MLTALKFSRKRKPPHCIAKKNARTRLRQPVSLKLRRVFQGYAEACGWCNPWRERAWLPPRLIRARLTRPHPCGANTIRGLSNLPYGRRQLFHRGLTAGRHPTFAGCEPFDMHGAFSYMSGDGLHTYKGSLLRNNAHVPTHPACAGCLLASSPR